MRELFAGQGTFNFYARDNTAGALFALWLLDTGYEASEVFNLMETLGHFRLLQTIAAHYGTPAQQALYNDIALLLEPQEKDPSFFFHL
ncbi:MAG: hypothetical protein KDD62_15265 [Bdellovibrionales bacterium]|nr:hypothetical protein [Bdellovibrionales bacterium]